MGRSGDPNKSLVLPLTLPHTQTHRHLLNIHKCLYCEACVAVNSAYRLRCYKRSPQPQQQCSTLPDTGWASDVFITLVFRPCNERKKPSEHTQGYACSRMQPGTVHALHMHIHTDTSRGKKKSKLGCTTKGRARRPPSKSHAWRSFSKQNKMVGHLSVAEWVSARPPGRDGM